MTIKDVPSSPDRKHPAHGVVLTDGIPTVIFDTVCIQGRARGLANEEVHSTLREVWLAADAWLLGRYVIMPDHIHFFAWYTGSAIEYDNWVRYWKSQFSKKYKHPEWDWQTDHWDTRMRSFEQYEEKWQYVRRNPERHGFVTDASEWPYQGEVYKLSWH